MKQLHGGEITRLGGDFDSILVASLLVASLPGGEMSSNVVEDIDLKLGQNIEHLKLRQNIEHLSLDRFQRDSKSCNV